MYGECVSYAYACVCMCLCVHKDCVAGAYYIKIKCLFAQINPFRLLELHCLPEED